MKKSLISLITNLPNYEYKGSDVEVTGVTDDSRNVKKGHVFVAVKGLTVDGHDYIEDAIKKGASAIVAEEAPKENWPKKISYVKVPDSRNALGTIASSWYDNPSQKMTVVGITGTDGKTTTTNILYELLNKAGKKVGMVSTLSAKVGNADHDTGFHVTNPDSLSLHKFLKNMHDVGCEYALVEVTSHGIDQGRIAGVAFDIAVLTNITHEHLDYHKTFEAYRDTKAKLFQMAKINVLNIDDQSFDVIAKNKEKENIATYSLHDKKADIYATDISYTPTGSSFTLHSHETSFPVELSMPGDYNISNALAATAVAAYLGVKETSLKKTLSDLPPLSGRLERIKNDKGIDIIVDFAHTPNSLERVLKEVAKTAKGKVFVIFGCASERDVNKRPQMAKIATENANVSIFTAEDPRKEDINAILKDMVKGVAKGAKEYERGQDIKQLHSGNWYIRVPERGDAISFAIQELAQKGDTIIICGKGHEKSMAYNGIEYEWSDQEAVRDALEGKTKVINHV